MNSYSLLVTVLTWVYSTSPILRPCWPSPQWKDGDS